jgi:hypothetical protein
MSVEKQKFMSTEVTMRHVFLYILTHVTCEMYRERSVKNLTLKKFGFAMKENLYRILLICQSTDNILPVFKCHAIKLYIEREVRLHKLLTSAADEDEWLTSISVALSAGKYHSVSIDLEVGWTSELIWT